MKISLITLMCFVFLGSAYSMSNAPVNGKEKKGSKKEVSDTDSSTSTNFHSIKKWKVTIVYHNGNSISQIIRVKENSNLSAMESAFIEAEKYSKTLKKVKDYSVSPVLGNSYVLLAGE